LTDVLQSDPLLQTPCVTFAMLGHVVFFVQKQHHVTLKNRSVITHMGGFLRCGCGRNNNLLQYANSVKSYLTFGRLIKWHTG
jgi:hypothetical protein